MMAQEMTPVLLMVVEVCVHGFLLMGFLDGGSRARARTLRTLLAGGLFGSGRKISAGLHLGMPTRLRADAGKGGAERRMGAAAAATQSGLHDRHREPASMPMVREMPPLWPASLRARPCAPEKSDSAAECRSSSLTGRTRPRRGRPAPPGRPTTPIQVARRPDVHSDSLIEQPERVLVIAVKFAPRPQVRARRQRQRLRLAERAAGTGNPRALISSRSRLK